MALGYAAIALAVLAILLPTVMVYKVRTQDGKREQLRTTQNTNNAALNAQALSGQQVAYQVAGGTQSLIIVGMVGVLIISVQILISIGFLPALG